PHALDEHVVGHRLASPALPRLGDRAGGAVPRIFHRGLEGAPRAAPRRRRLVEDERASPRAAIGIEQIHEPGTREESAEQSRPALHRVASFSRQSAASASDGPGWEISSTTWAIWSDGARF